MSIEESQIYKNPGMRGDISGVDFDIKAVTIKIADGYFNGINIIKMKTGEIGIVTTSPSGGWFEVKVLTDEIAEKLKQLFTKTPSSESSQDSTDI